MKRNWSTIYCIVFFAETVGDFDGTAALGDADMNLLVQNLLAMKRAFEGRGQVFIIAVAPNKNTLYGEQMPFGYKQTDAPTNLDRLLVVDELECIDLGSALLASKQLGQTVYHETDSHWNAFGARIAAREIMLAIEEKTGVRAEFDWAGGSFETIDVTGDLGQMLYPSNPPIETDRFYEDTGQQYTTNARYRSLDDLHITTASDGVPLRVAMYRDSFANSLIPYFSNAYSDVYYTRQTPPPFDSDAFLDADVIVLQIAERRIGELLTGAETPIVAELPTVAETPTSNATPTATPTPTFAETPSGTPAPTAMPEVRVGDIIEFGNYDWIVLDVQDGKALIIADRIIDVRQYHHDYIEVTWAESGVRSYLNGQFYNGFHPSDRARIADANVANDDNEWYGTDGGEDTLDKIFLLSLSEVAQYFGDSGEFGAGPGEMTGGPFTYTDDAGNEHTYYRWERSGFDDQFDKARTVRYIFGTASWWWLRSPGALPSTAANVNIDGSVYVIGDYVTTDGGGIRPALWLELES